MQSSNGMVFYFRLAQTKHAVCLSVQQHKCRYCSSNSVFTHFDTDFLTYNCIDRESHGEEEMRLKCAEKKNEHL